MAEHLHIVMGTPLDEVLDVTVEGTWQKRGRTSLFGIVVAIACKTGQVLTWEVLSKLCFQIEGRHGFGRVSRVVGRAKEECECNCRGSSNGMAIAGVKTIWLRSVKNLKLRYTTFIGDGDSKTLLV